MFYNPFHKMIMIALFGLWIGLHKLPERFCQSSRKISMYFNSSILKTLIILGCLVWLHIMLKDTSTLASKMERRQVLTPVETHSQQLFDQSKLNQQITDHKKLLEESKA